MSIKRKLISILLIIILFLTIILPAVYANDDTNPPNIISISANNTNISAGDTASFNIQIEDDFSGVSIIFIEWKLKTDETKSISKQFNNVNNNQQFDYVIPENTYSGEWQAVYISVSDYADNHKLYNIDTDGELLSKLDFEIKDGNQDTEAPVVSNVKIVTENFSAPCEVAIQYDVIDDKSGVKSNSGGAIYSPASDSSNEISGVGIKISDNTYQSILKIETKYERFIFKYIQVCDNAGNWKKYTYEDLGLQNELDVTPSNYEEDTIAPKMTSIEYNKTKLNIPDSLEVLLDIEENESGTETRGLACFKSEDDRIIGNKYIASNYKSYTIVDNPELAEYYSPEPNNPYLFIGNIIFATDNHGKLLNNKLKARIDFNESENFRGNIYLDKVILLDKAGNKAVYSTSNNSIKKEIITISKIEREYTLKTSTAKKNYINEIVELPEGSTVLCNVVISNQIIEKELFDAIKGKDITITFLSIYNGSTNVTSAGGSISSSDTNMGIQWIINGKDIVNETKDIDMKTKFAKKKYSKYIIPEYEINENLEIDFWNSSDLNDLTDEELRKKEQELIELQKIEIKKYFDALKHDGYVGVDEAYNNTISKAEYQYGADCKTAILYANDYVEYLSIEFANNGLLPCKTLIRIKPEYATRALIGTKDLSLYYSDGNNYSLIKKDINIDEENCYNFNITHNSEYLLTNGNFEKLNKSDESSNKESSNTTSIEEFEGDIVDEKTNTTSNIARISSSNPKTGDNITMWTSLMFVSVSGIIGIIKLIKNNKKN